MIDGDISFIQWFFSVDFADRFYGNNHFPVFFHLLQIPLFRRIELVHDSWNTGISFLKILDQVKFHPALYDFIVLSDIIRPFFLYLNLSIQTIESQKIIHQPLFLIDSLCKIFSGSAPLLPLHGLHERSLQPIRHVLGQSTFHSRDFPVLTGGQILQDHFFLLTGFHMADPA